MNSVSHSLKMSFAVLALIEPATGLLAQQRIDPVPMGPESVVQALSPFAAPLDSSEVASLLLGLAETGFPATDDDRVLAARLWRAADEPQLAASTLNTISDSSSAMGLALYELARTWLSGNHPERGARAYWLVCNSQDERVRAEIFWDLLPATIAAERTSWLEVASGSATCEWLRRFWNQRAQRMAIPTDDRLARHFQRLAMARRSFFLRRPRAGGDMASDHGRVAGLAVDDRGLLYIRKGPPDYSQGCPEEIPIPPDSTFTNRLGVCWVYSRPTHYEIYYLTTRDRFGWNLPDNDFRIQESFGQLAEPGTLLFQKYVANSDIPESTLAGLTAYGPVFRLRRLIRFDSAMPSSLGGLAAAFRPLLPEPSQEVEHRRYEREVTLATRRYTSAAFEQIPDAPDVKRTADLQFEALRFLNPTEREWQIWLLGAVPGSQLKRSIPHDNQTTIDVSGRFSFLSAEDMRLEHITPRSIRADRIPQNAGISVLGALAAGPGPLTVTFVIEDLNSKGGGAWIQDTINVPSIGGLPQLSDIAIAQSEGGTWTRDGETYLNVSPAHVTNSDGSIHTYFEAYGVDPGARYDVAFRLVPSDAAERVWRIDPGNLAFRLQFSAQMSGDIGRHHLRLDLSDTEPGAYVLAVRIQDERTKAYSLPSVTDVFIPDR